MLVVALGTGCIVNFCQVATWVLNSGTGTGLPLVMMVNDDWQGSVAAALALAPSCGSDASKYLVINVGMFDAHWWPGVRYISVDLEQVW